MTYGRPQYENSKTLKNEERLAAFMGPIWKCDFFKMPKSYIIDFAAFRGGKILSWAEIKRRHNSIEKYPTYMVALKKVVAARGLQEATGLPCFIVVWWDDAIGYVELSGQEIYPVQIGGRSDRNDPADKEPVTHIPISRFKIIAGLNSGRSLPSSPEAADASP